MTAASPENRAESGSMPENRQYQASRVAKVARNSNGTINFRYRWSRQQRAVVRTLMAGPMRAIELVRALYGPEFNSDSHPGYNKKLVSMVTCLRSLERRGHVKRDHGRRWRLARGYTDVTLTQEILAPW